MAKISICICTMNRPTELRRCLEGIEKSSIKPYEVIVSDDSNEELVEETETITSSFKDTRYIRGPRKGVAANRNNCLDYLNGEFVSFVDDDVIISPDFLKEALVCFDQVCLKYRTDKIVVTGTVKMICENEYELLPLNLDFLGYHKKPVRYGDEQRAISMSNNLFPSSLFRRVKFDENTHTAEERDISLHALHVGFKIVYNPKIMVYHYMSSHSNLHNQEIDEISRFYFGLKRYWIYEQSIPRFLLFSLYAPLRPLVGRIAKFQPKEIQTIIICYFKAWKLFLAFHKTMTSDKKGIS